MLPFFVACAALAAFADDSPRFVPGLLPNAPGKEIRVRELATARRAPLLRSMAEELPVAGDAPTNELDTTSARFFRLTVGLQP